MILFSAFGHHPFSTSLTNPFQPPYLWAPGFLPVEPALFVNESVTKELVFFKIVPISNIPTQCSHKYCIKKLLWYMSIFNSENMLAHFNGEEDG